MQSRTDIVDRAIRRVLVVAIAIGAASCGSNGPTAPIGSSQLVAPCGPFRNAQVDVPLYVYEDAASQRNFFIPSGFFGDITDLALTQDDRSQPHGGTSSIRIIYRPRGNERFAGIVWQCPANNFGTQADAGFDLGRAHEVQFWARAETLGRAEFKVGGVGRTPPLTLFPDSFESTSTNPPVVEFDTDWRQFTIDVTGRDLTRVIGGFMFVTNADQNPTGFTLFLDDIVWR